MRTLIVVGVGGFLALAIAFFARSLHRPPAHGALVFVAGWFVFCAFDLAAGVRAGYSATEELGIHLVIFGVPAVAAWGAARVLG